MQLYGGSSPVEIIIPRTSTDLFMSKKQQGLPAALPSSAQLAFPNLPAPVSSASSLTSTNGSVSSQTLSTQVDGSLSPVAALAAPTGAAATSSLAQALSACLQQQHQVSAANSCTTIPFKPQLATTTSVASAASNPGLLMQSTSTSYLVPPSYHIAAAATMGGAVVPEFLYQLTKMLTDAHNRNIIEWSTYSGNGRIEVHDPARLEKEVLGRYFRHSKYSSFQRQLNYFGWRKIAGKGKMSPCSYINDLATTDIRCLLKMKRKNANKEKEAEGNQGVTATALQSTGSTNNKRRSNPADDIQPVTVRPLFATSAVSSDSVTTMSTNNSCNKNNNELFNAMTASLSSSRNPANIIVSNKRPKLTQPKSILLSSTNGGRKGYSFAIGKGVGHKLNGYLKSDATAHNNTSGNINSNTQSTAYSTNYLSHPSAKAASSTPASLQFLEPSELGMSIESSLSQLKENFDAAAGGSSVGGTTAASLPTTALSHTVSASSSSNASSYNSNSSNDSSKFMPSALTQRISSMSSLGGMLSRDDSLINLAMLPTLDSTNGGSNSNNNSSGRGNTKNQGSQWEMSRADSLLNLAAAISAVEDNHQSSTTKASLGADETETFSFIDFES